MLWAPRLTILTLVAILTSPAPSVGQEGPVDPPVDQGADEQTRGSSLLRDIGTDLSGFFTSPDTYTLLGLGLGASAALRPLDDDVIGSRMNGELYQGHGLDSAFETGEIVGGAFVQFGGAFAAYGIGRVAGRPGMSELGRELVRVQLLSGGVTQLLKYTVKRRRPDGSNRASFPSGHASGTFATAAVLHRRYGPKVGAPAIAVASYVAASRLTENTHHLSDVVFGAAVGLAAGRVVTVDRGSTRFELRPLAVAGGGGVQVSVFTRR